LLLFSLIGKPALGIVEGRHSSTDFYRQLTSANHQTS